MNKKTKKTYDNIRKEFVEYVRDCLNSSDCPNVLKQGYGLALASGMSEEGAIWMVATMLTNAHFAEEVHGTRPSDMDMLQKMADVLNRSNGPSA